LRKEWGKKSKGKSQEKTCWGEDQATVKKKKTTAALKLVGINVESVLAN